MRLRSGCGCTAETRKARRQRGGTRGVLRGSFMFLVYGAVGFGQSLWHDPGDVEKMDFAAAAEAPRAPFTFVKEDLSGTQPKVFVRDAGGTTWNVKFGYEVHNESFCWRVVRACGYFTEPSYFVAAGQFVGYKPLQRATKSISADGRFTEGRFQLRDPAVKFLDHRNWRWDRPPFAGTRELSGLKILIMLFSNWDNKDGRVGKGGPNTAIFDDHGRVVYAFTDWGSGMGRWGSVPGSNSNWNCADFTAQSPEFVKRGANGGAVFGWSGAINAGFRTGIPVTHIAWFMKYLGRITDAQLGAALRAAGASDKDADCFSKALRQRIEELRSVGAAPAAMRK
jgi:hypothetical protein